MPPVRHLRRAPIVEAVIDYRVKARGDLDASAFLALHERVRTRFPKHKEQRGVLASVNVAGALAEPPRVEDLGVVGHCFSSDDEKTLAQFRIDGLTINRLHPYTAWNQLYPLAAELWDLYLEVARPDGVVRLAVRTINRIPLPSRAFDFQEYFVASPFVPPELPQSVSGFLTRITIPDRTRDIAAHIAQTLASGPEGLSVIIDIDAFRDGPVAENHVAGTFEMLRDFKNVAFFSLLTESCLREFE